jgi:hypothetical protein
MKKRRSSIIVLPDMVVLQPTVVNVSNPVADVSTEVVDEGFNLSLGEDLQNEIVSDEALKRVEWGLLCVHPDALMYQDCLCYNSRFCRTKCEFRNKGK